MSAPLVPNISAAPPPPSALPPVAAGVVRGASPNGASGRRSPTPPLAAPAASDEKPARQKRATLWGRFNEWTAEGEFSAWLSSAVVHAALILLLSLLVLARPGSGPNLLLEGSIDDVPVEDAQIDFSAMSDGGPETSLPTVPQPVLGAIDAPTEPVIASTEAPLLVEPTAPVGEMAFDPLPAMAAPLAMYGGGLEGRKLSNRHGLALAGGGSEASEAAVEAGLAWLAEHQYPDGGWRFDLDACPNCAGYCRNSGVNDSSTAATGLALLSFLGAGYTHQEGKYVEVVKRGLYYLNEQMNVTTHGGDLRDMRVRSVNAENTPAGIAAALEMVRGKADTMYAHGIASLALTEGYAMTQDPGLRQPAELAVKFIINGQNADGGWRYAPSFETPADSDTTVSGWQVMALKSAALGGIPVPYEVWMKISRFFDINATADGSEYAYVAGRRGTRATSAIGLLCRELEGWPRDHRALQRGLANLGSQRPQDNHMYYNYYATLALHHAGGSEWGKWNPKMRDYLVKSQSDEGHEHGSWYFDEQYANDGGRLYTTALSVLTLEVYYRYLPLYKHGAPDAE